MAIEKLIDELTASAGKEIAVVVEGSDLERDRAVYCLEQMNPAVSVRFGRTGRDEVPPDVPLFYITVAFKDNSVRGKLKNALYRCSASLHVNPEENAQTT